MFDYRASQQNCVAAFSNNNCKRSGLVLKRPYDAFEVFASPLLCYVAFLSILKGITLSRRKHCSYTAWKTWGGVESLLL